jgi:hypothetical protein
MGSLKRRDEDWIISSKKGQEAKGENGFKPDNYSSHTRPKGEGIQKEKGFKRRRNSFWEKTLAFQPLGLRFLALSK